MKKIILSIALILYFGNANSQINNLSDFLAVSELSVEGLTENLQYTWKIEPPKEQISENGKAACDTYYYTYQKNNKIQMLKRIISVGLYTDFRIESTELWCSDLELLKRILKNLAYNGFELKEKQGVRSLYEDGNRSLMVQTASTTKKKLPNGCYSISILPIN